MAFLKGNTYIDGDLIVDGDVSVGSLSAAGVNFAQIEGTPEDYRIALTNSSGNLISSTIKETSSGTMSTYTLNNISNIDMGSNTLTVTSPEVNINTPVNKVTTGKAGTMYWVYADGSTRAATDSDDGKKPGTSDPYQFPVGVTFK